MISMGKNSKAKSELLSRQIFQLLVQIPAPTVGDDVSDVDMKINQLVRNTSIQTSSISAALSIPGGVTGLITVLPEITAIWRLQSQMITNIAALHGQTHLVTREQMLYCMFRQMGFGLVKEYVFQRGGVYLVRKMSDQAFSAVLQKLSRGLITRQGTRMAGKIIPLVGSISAGALSYYDTFRVGKNARRLYSHEIKLLEPGEAVGRLEKE